jgi:hypothetical protein
MRIFIDLSGSGIQDLVHARHLIRKFGVYPWQSPSRHVLLEAHCGKFADRNFTASLKE